MKMKRIKPLVIPMIYGVCVIAFLFCMYFAGKLSNNFLFKDKNVTNYVDGEIVSEYDNDIPVVSTSSIIVRPYLDSNVSIYKTFYDYQDEINNQENSIILYEGTYMQNSGVDYTSDNSFDVISILDGTVINVYENEILGTSIEIRHNNDLISVYQSLSDVTVKEGDNVIQGQILAKSGLSNINRELNNHLHFELYYKGTIVNPEEYYNKSVDEL
ncbi:MAG: peptidoglycan DD-metalloendopeptidase family protein [Bacilli bacterium]